MDGDIIVRAKAHGTTQIVDASQGGCSFTISPFVEVEANPSPSALSVEGASGADKIILDTASNVQHMLGHEFGVSFRVDKQIPRSLGYLEAVSCATAHLVCALTSKLHGSGMHRLRLNKNLLRDFYIVDGGVVGLPRLLECCFQDETSIHKTASCFFGGFTVCIGRQIARRGDMEKDLKGVAVFNPDFKLHNLGQNNLLLDEALKNNLYQASNLFCSANANEEAKTASKKFKDNALFQSLNPGCLVGFHRDEDKIKKVEGNPDSMNVGVVNTPAFLEENPKSLVKVKKFAKIPGSLDFGWL